MSPKRQVAALWVFGGVAALILLYLAAAWFMWRAPSYFPSGPLAELALMILLNDHAGFDSSIWEPAYALFRCFSDEPLHFSTLASRL